MTIAILQTHTSVQTRTVRPVLIYKFTYMPHGFEERLEQRSDRRSTAPTAELAHYIQEGAVGRTTPKNKHGHYVGKVVPGRHGRDVTQPERTAAC